MVEDRKPEALEQASAARCRILSLDGGGAKGFYTIGVLKEIEAMAGRRPLSECFDIIFGTSTGGIIAALLALGYRVEDIHRLAFIWCDNENSTNAFD